jgi:DNA (cytosine-5)-methyltransferase 1
LLRVLNLYAGIGGNRKKWEDCEVTAVELDSDTAAAYQTFFPHDRVIVADAHEYLLKHYNDYDFIWTSPPCQTHSSWRQNICVRYRGSLPVYPDMKLYQEIVFLKHNCRSRWVVENVRPYYQPLIEPDVVLQRHLFWTNVAIPVRSFSTDLLRDRSSLRELQDLHGFDVSQMKLKDRRQVLRNCVSPSVGKYIFDVLRGELGAVSQEEAVLAG